MNKLTSKFYLALQALQEEHGQDLIEYVLIGAIVALAAIAGMSTFAGNINSAFTNLGTKLTSYTS